MAKDREEPVRLDIEEACKRLEDLLHGKFRKATDAGDADAYYTTEELFSMVDGHSPELVPKPQFREALLKLGYVEMRLESQFVWLLRTAA
jgi:hypothetical protein